MSFQPSVPLGGIAGWSFLNRTMARQTQSFENSAEFQRRVANFSQKIGQITSAKDLVADRELLQVALGAFGLGDDLDKGFFIRKVLEEGTTNPRSFANRLVDKRYTAFSDAFGFGSKFGPKTARAGFAKTITAPYTTRQFEIAVGNKNEPLRLALSFAREIAEIAKSPATSNTGWFRILGAPPLRKVIEGAFNLPQQFAALDIDRQVSVLKDKATSLLGSNTIDIFLDPVKVETVVRRFLVRSQTTDVFSGTSAASMALTLLQQGSDDGFAPNTIESIFGALYPR